MSAHIITVTYTWQDDGIWLECTCGEPLGAGFEPGIAALGELAAWHVEGALDVRP